MNQRAIIFNKQGTGEQRTSYYGFSWTAMFFTPFLQIFRKDLRGFLLFFVVYYLYGAVLFPMIISQSSTFIGYLTQLILWLGSGLCYNKIHLLILLNSGYTPTLAADASFLRDKGFYIKKGGK